jgi:hypothetical protein
MRNAAEMFSLDTNPTRAKNAWSSSTCLLYAVCPILMFFTACDIYIKSENDCRLYILLYYELKFNRNNLFMFQHIFSIKNLKHK